MNLDRCSSMRPKRRWPFFERASCVWRMPMSSMARCFSILVTKDSYDSGLYVKVSAGKGTAKTSSRDLISAPQCNIRFVIVSISAARLLQYGYKLPLEARAALKQREFGNRSAEQSEKGPLWKREVQYSSGSRTVVTLLSASVIRQKAVPWEE